MESYRVYYKSKSKFGATELNKDDKRKGILRDQKKKREETFLSRRNIDVDTEASPAAEVQLKVTDTRREKLLRWQAEKEAVRKQQQTEKKKPPFKVGIAHHPVDPLKEITAVAQSTFKGTTAKKTAAKTCAKEVGRNERKPTAAAVSLAALAAPQEFSGRVTRSRTAAAAPKPAAPKPVRGSRVTKQVPVKEGNRSAKSQAVASKAQLSSRAKSSTRSTKQVAAKSTHLIHENSFAPNDHKFKAPGGLTLPTTPLTLKRTRSQATKVSNWLTIPGISELTASPKPSPPKSLKRGSSTARELRTRTLARSQSKSPKPCTPAQTKTRAHSSAESPNIRLSSTPAGVLTISVTDSQCPPSNSEGLSSEIVPSPAMKSRKSSSKKRMSSFRAEPMESDDLGTEPVLEAVHVSEMIEAPQNLTPMKAKGKSRRSIKGKENVPEDQTVQMQTPGTEADIEVVQVRASRMSIHEPSPPVSVTPDKLATGMVPAQFSPYITVARGKERHSSRRRSSIIGLNVSQTVEEMANAKQVEHFRSLLERETTRLLKLADLWEERREQAPEEAQDQILGPLGQARLLTKDKFNQFRTLVDKFERGDSNEKITAEDLTGFWEMILLTVDNLDSRFNKLEELLANNWEEKKPEVVRKKRPVPAPATDAAAVTGLSKPVRKVAQTVSRLQAMIKAAREKKLEAKRGNNTGNTTSDCATFDGGFFKVESPRKLEPSPRSGGSSPANSADRCAGLPTTPGQLPRRSLLQHVLLNSAVRVQNSPVQTPSSPSPRGVLAQIRASQIGRKLSIDSSLSDSSLTPPKTVLSNATPAKSILKSSLRTSIAQRNRVAFQMSSSPGLIKTPLSAVVNSNVKTPVPSSIGSPNVQSVSLSAKRRSLIPRPVQTPGLGDVGARPSLMPMRESTGSPKPFPGGDLIDWGTPTAEPRQTRFSRRISNVQ